MSETCAIALGSNQGNSWEIVQQALGELATRGKIEKVSRWYRTKAIGYRSGEIVVVDQPDFVNGCVILTTSLAPMDLLQSLLRIESDFGRTRREPYSARTLDLDLLFYGDRVINLPGLIVPHPRMTDRAFVLLPLAEIAPQWKHPINNRSVEELAKIVAINAPCSPVLLNYGN